MLQKDKQAENERDGWRGNVVRSRSWRQDQLMSLQTPDSGFRIQEGGDRSQRPSILEGTLLSTPVRSFWRNKHGYSSVESYF